jgi:hypothetical protein
MLVLRSSVPFSSICQAAAFQLCQEGLLLLLLLLLLLPSTAIVSTVCSIAVHSNSHQKPVQAEPTTRLCIFSTRPSLDHGSRF